MQSLGFATRPINLCARSSLAQPLGLPVFVARPWLSSTHSAASWPVLSSTVPRSLLPRRSWAPQRFDRGGARFSASVSRFDHSLAGPRIVFAMADQHFALVLSLVSRFDSSAQAAGLPFSFQ
jgi:hypothetical protein